MKLLPFLLVIAVYAGCRDSRHDIDGGPGILWQPEKPYTWEDKILDQLEKRISFDFLETPLDKVVSELCIKTGVSIIVDPAAFVDDMGTPIPLWVTLKVENMKGIYALNWITRLSGLNYILHDEAILIGDVQAKCYTEIYPIDTIFLLPPDEPAPYLGPYGSIRNRSYNTLALWDSLDEDSYKDLIECQVAPEYWCGDNPDSWVEVGEGRLIISASQEIHRMIKAFIKRLKVQNTIQIRVTADIYEFSKKLTEGLTNKLAKEPDTFYLDASDKERIGNEVNSGMSKKLESIFVTGFNGQQVHVLSGQTSNGQFSGMVFESRAMLDIGMRNTVLDMSVRQCNDEGRLFSCSAKAFIPIGKTVMFTGGSIEGEKEKSFVVLVTPEIFYYNSIQ